MGVCNCSLFRCTLLYVHSSIVIILMGKRELIALRNLSAWCLVMVEPLFLAVPRGCLQFVIVVLPDHTHLLFLNYIFNMINITFWTHAHKAGATLSKPLRTILAIQQKVAPVFTSPNGINFKVSKSAKIRNRYKQVPHMTYRHKGIQTFQ